MSSAAIRLYNKLKREHSEAGGGGGRRGGGRRCTTREARVIARTALLLAAIIATQNLFAQIAQVMAQGSAHAFKYEPGPLFLATLKCVPLVALAVYFGRRDNDRRDSPAYGRVVGDARYRASEEEEEAML